MTQQELKDLITGLMENHIYDRCCSEQERERSRAQLADALATIDQIEAAMRERCALICEARAAAVKDQALGTRAEQYDEALECADAIREA